MPALFCLGLHDALASVGSIIQADEKILAYLDDIYIFASPERTRFLYEVVAAAIKRHAGIEVNSFLSY